MSGRADREGVAAEFLRDALAGGALGVPKLEAMARAAGLLGERQSITHAKTFKQAKKSVGIRSVRNGFGDGGGWCWLLEKQPDPPAREPPFQLLNRARERGLRDVALFRRAREVQFLRDGKKITDLMHFHGGTPS
jgi:hypothetical protein